MIALLAPLVAGCGLLGGGSTPAAPPPQIDTSLVPHVKACPPATGGLAGITLGQVRLGMTRAEVRRAYTQSNDRGTPFEDFFCLTPIGVRVAFASPALLHTLSASEQSAIDGRVIWVSTANRRYGLGRIRPGAPIAKARGLPLVGPVRVGLNDWYFAPHGASTLVFKVRHGVIQEIGIAQTGLTGSLAADTALIRSLPAIAEGS
jgi:hypothetical protein